LINTQQKNRLMENLSSGWAKVLLAILSAVIGGAFVFGMNLGNKETELATLKTELKTTKSTLESELKSTQSRLSTQESKVAKLDDIKEDLDDIKDKQKEHAKEIISGKMERNDQSGDIRHIKESLMEMTSLLKQLLNSQHQHRGSSRYGPPEPEREG